MLHYREDLDTQQCEHDGCTHTDHPQLIFNARCHPGHPTWCTYDRQNGVLLLTCGHCQKPVVSIAIAARPWVDPLARQC